MPETDVKALIERYRTGPFHPVAQVYEDIQHDQGDVVFGINLRRWSESNWDGLTTIEEKQDKLPAVITAMLAALEDSYAKLTDDAGEFCANSDLCSVSSGGHQRSASRGYMKYLYLQFITFEKHYTPLPTTSRSPPLCLKSMTRRFSLVLLSSGCWNSNPLWLSMNLTMIFGRFILLVSILLCIYLTRPDLRHFQSVLQMIYQILKEYVILRQHYRSYLKFICSC